MNHWLVDMIWGPKIFIFEPILSVFLPKAPESQADFTDTKHFALWSILFILFWHLPCKKVWYFIIFKNWYSVTFQRPRCLVESSWGSFRPMLKENHATWGLGVPFNFSRAGYNVSPFPSHIITYGPTYWDKIGTSDQNWTQVLLNAGAFCSLPIWDIQSGIM